MCHRRQKQNNDFPFRHGERRSNTSDATNRIALPE
jgi:hypothetical protein